MARLCTAQTAIEMVTVGIGGLAGAARHNLAPAACLHAAVRPGLPDIATTLLVTFWYAWLFNRTGGSVLLTLIAHVTEGSVNVKALWLAGPACRPAWTWLVAWALLVAALLIFDRVLADGTRIGKSSCPAG